MPDGEISKHVDTLQIVAQGCTGTLSPNLLKVYIDHMVVNSSRSRKARSHGGGTYGVEIDVCLRMISRVYEKHPTDCRGKTDREGTRVHTLLTGIGEWQRT